jgi:hypothetical protein
MYTGKTLFAQLMDFLPWSLRGGEPYQVVLGWRARGEAVTRAYRFGSLGAPSVSSEFMM